MADKDRRLRRAVKDFQDDLAGRGMQLQGVEDRDGTPVIVIGVGKEEGMARRKQHEEPPIPEIEDAVGEQVQFEGMPVRGVSFQLKAYNGLLEPETKYEIGDEVGGEWKGIVVGVHHDDEKGSLVRKHVIVVTKATVS